MQIPLGILLDLVGSLLIASLGVFVAFLRPVATRTLLVGVFGFSFGAQFVLTNMLRIVTDAEVIAAGTGPAWFHWARTILRAAAAAALVGVALHVPERLRRHELPWARTAAVVAFTVFAATTSLKAVHGGLPDLLDQGFAPMLGDVSLDLILGAHVFAILCLALRFVMVAEHGRATRRQCGHMAAALTLYPGFVAGAGLYTLDSPLSEEGSALAVGLVYLAATGLQGVIWIVATRGPDAHLARNITLVTMAMPLVGMAYYLSDVRSGGHGLVRTIGFVVLTYAIVKHQLLGIDVKIRFAIKHSTLAGIFVASAFIVSEGTQEFLGATTSSPYLGIAATGILVFAIAPLQRFAENLSRKAVPTGPGGRDDELGFYADQVRTAWMDGSITRREALILQNLRTRLGISEADAHRVEQEAMRQ